MSIIAKTYRGNMVDLTHIGHIAVVNHKGELLYYYGDPNRVTFARSSAKPIQAIPVLESGAIEKYGITDKEIAIFCASHSGEDFHVKTVESILKKAELNKDYLQCGSHYPIANYASKELKSKGLEPENIHCNCSGKHSGMLITAKYYGEDLDSYYKQEHPVQRRIMNTLSEVCEYDENKIITAIDGCGVPVHAMPLYKFAHGFAKLSKPEVFNPIRKKVVSKIITSMTKYPEMVGGTNRICTDLMKICGDRLFAKSGASAYYAIGLKDKGIGIAFKIEDGNSKIMPAIVLETLKQLKIITDKELKQLEKYYILDIKNHKKEIVGQTKTEFDLIKNN
ncbi:asparaginase [Clostridiisalibacter paucivorans]|uniref:asparaginase n=1 Tax=Clostridiisalibacter paucivorans TaxID=408753 RepID=UPI00047DAE88|nr:asparaginase [Clostridiisalibacter paucivorans]